MVALNQAWNDPISIANSNTSQSNIAAHGCGNLRAGNEGSHPWAHRTGMATRASIHQRSSRKRHFSSLKTHRLARGCLYQIAKRVDFDLQACEENIRSGVECEETYPKTYDRFTTFPH